VEAKRGSPKGGEPLCRTSVSRRGGIGSKSTAQKNNIPHLVDLQPQFGRLCSAVYADGDMSKPAVDGPTANPFCRDMCRREKTPSQGPAANKAMRIGEYSTNQGACCENQGQE